MGLNEDRIKAINFDYSETIPISASFLPAAWMKYREALDEIIARHPLLFGQKGKNPDYDAVGGTYVEGEPRGCLGLCMEQPANRHGSDCHRAPGSHPRLLSLNFKPPEMDSGFPHGFMFLRLADLRGFEEVMIDFAEEPPELQNADRHRAAVQPAPGRPAAQKARRQAEIVYFGDDLGMQTSLPMSPREVAQIPEALLYQQIYRPFREAGHTVYMHTDGHILEIIPDLIDAGVKVVNPQSRANGIDGLARVCKGKVCVDLDLDRQLFPFASPSEIDAHVREAVEMLGSPEGGLWLKAEMNYEVPLENIEAVCAALERYRTYYS